MPQRLGAQARAARGNENTSSICQRYGWYAKAE